MRHEIGAVATLSAHGCLLEFYEVWEAQGPSNEVKENNTATLRILRYGRGPCRATDAHTISWRVSTHNEGFSAPQSRYITGEMAVSRTIPKQFAPGPAASVH